MATLEDGRIMGEFFKLTPLLEVDAAGLDGVDSPLPVSIGVVTLGISMDGFAKNPKRVCCLKTGIKKIPGIRNCSAACRFSAVDVPGISVNGGGPMLVAAVCKNNARFMEKS